MVRFKRVWILDAIVKDFFSYVKFNNLIAYVVFFFESCVVASECIVTLDVDCGDWVSRGGDESGVFLR